MEHGEGEVSHLDILRRLQAGDARFRRIEEEQRRAATVRDRNAATLERIESKVDTTKEIVEAWGAVKTVGRFVKWSSGVIAAVTIIIVAVKAFASAWLAGGHPPPN